MKMNLDDFKFKKNEFRIRRIWTIFRFKRKNEFRINVERIWTILDFRKNEFRINVERFWNEFGTNFKTNLDDF